MVKKIFYLLVVSILLCGYFSLAFASALGTWSATGSMSTARGAHAMAFLKDGKILIAGGYNSIDGYLASAEIYNPSTSAFTPTGSMINVRDNFTATTLIDGKVLIAGGKYNLTDGSALASAELYDPATGTFTPTGSMSIPRYNHTATVLFGGKVLITGGYNSSGHLASAELYDPVTGTFTPTGSMITPRGWHTATMLNSGKILIVAGATTGNYTLRSAEIYDPATGTFSSTGLMTNFRDFHTATRLPDGRVLIAGGYSNPPGSLISAEIYNPATGTFSLTGSMATARDGHTAALLPNGKVLVAGGWNSVTGAPLSSVELFDPATGAFAPTNSMATTRTRHTGILLPNGKLLIAGGLINNNPYYATATAELYCPEGGGFTLAGLIFSEQGVIGQALTATLLPNGKVLIAGGALNSGNSASAAVLYDPAANSFLPTGSMGTARRGHTATLLTNGKVLIAGGYNSTDGYLASAELYDPTTGLFTSTGPMGSARYFSKATLLTNGKVLISGGYNSTNNYLASAELYDPVAGTFMYTGSMWNARQTHTATLLPNGKVLIAGGWNSSPLASAELYDPVTGGFTYIGSMNAARDWLSATLLPNGKVLIAGGWNSTSGSLASAESYDPATGVFTYTGSMVTARDGHTATLLSNGNVLIAAGADSHNLNGYLPGSAELYDPASGGFTFAGAVQNARTGHKATLLPNGKVLIAGGWQSSNRWIGSAELYYYSCCGPFIGMISPASGSVGTSVTITGYNFGATQGSSTVTFNGISAASAISWNDEQIIINVPSGASTGSVIVTVDGIASNGINFTVTACVDNDGDGYGNPGNASCPNGSATDCDDNDPTVNPGATEGPYGDPTCKDGKDNDCDGKIDAADPGCFPPDLLVSSWTAPANACPGTTITIKDTTKNQGTGTAGASTTKFYFSTNTTLDPSDTPLGSRSIPSLLPGGISTGTTPVTLPNVPTGKYYLIAMADDGKVVTESNETNNKKTKTIYIGPDLTVVSIVPSPLKPVAGQNVSITVTVKNIGCPAAGPFRVDFYKNLSTAPALYQAGDFNCSISGLAAGATATCTGNVSYSPSGIYKMWAQVDTMQQVIEANETNNKKSRLITVNP